MQLVTHKLDILMSLTTGKRVSTKQWDKVPMPDRVVTVVEKMAKDQDQPLPNSTGPYFEWSPGIEVNKTTDNIALTAKNSTNDTDKEDNSSSVSNNNNRVNKDSNEEGPTDNDTADESYTDSDKNYTATTDAKENEPSNKEPDIITDDNNSNDNNKEVHTEVEEGVSDEEDSSTKSETD